MATLSLPYLWNMGFDAGEYLHNHADTALDSFSACESGLSDTTYGRGNLVEKAREKGIFCTIGWKVTIDRVASDYWTEQFFKACYEGNNASEAMSIADSKTTTKYPDKATALKQRHYGTSQPTALLLNS